jgi:hypothetical protein
LKIRADVILRKFISAAWVVNEVSICIGSRSQGISAAVHRRELDKAKGGRRPASDMGLNG